MIPISGKASYTELSMAEYIYPLDIVITIDQKKWIFKTLTEDIDLPANRRWMEEDAKCSKCIPISRSEQAPGCEFQPRDESDKNDCSCLEPSWYNKKVKS